MPPIPYAPVWSSPFRSFGLLGVGYGVALMATWAAIQAGIVPADAIPAVDRGWHGHEMLFGFAGAIVCAIVLTALPGWAATPEPGAAWLASVASLWIVGRIAWWAQGALPAALVVAAACALWIALALRLAVELLRVAERRYLALVVVVAGILAGEALALSGQSALGLSTMVHSLALLYALAAGVFTPVFTGNHLRLHRRGDLAAARMPLEVAALASIVVFAVLDLAGAAPATRTVAAFAAAALNAIRMVRWRGWRVADAPLLWTMHAGYAWLVVALALAGLSAAGDPAAARAWLHAFTVGALGSMMIGLLTRVVLKHTGRPLVLPAAIVVAHLLVQVAAVARVGAAWAPDGRAAITASALAWTAAFALYLGSFAAYLVRPSLPRTDNPLTDETREPPNRGR